MRSAGFQLDGVIGEGTRTAFEVLAEIQKIDPRMHRWLMAPSKTRGRRPLCTGEVADLILEAQAALGV